MKKKVYCIAVAVSVVCFLFSLKSAANNITVSSVTLIAQNKTADYVQVKFDLSWENSFLAITGPSNCDAAWVFVKYKIGDNGEWKHASLSTSGGHVLPSGASSSQGDSKGVFIYKEAIGTSNLSLTGVQLRWNYGVDGVGDESKIYVKVFAIEMVLVPQGDFQVGSGGQNSGEFRRANDVSSSGTTTTFTITNNALTLQGNNSSSSSSNLSTRLGAGNDLSSGTSTASLGAGYPTGYAAFYCMKFEITQGQYRDFLNTLTFPQQVTRTANSPNSAIGTGALTSSGTARNGIEIKVSGTANATPAVYACDATNDNNFDQSNDGAGIACNYLNWDDVAAYLDWASLRPITELEYEKVSRGTLTPVVNEFAWGSASSTSLASILNTALANEASNTTGANLVGNNAFSGGPVRVGLFATATSTRISAGSSYYGVMEMSGNVWEQVVPISNANARSFSNVMGDGTLNSNGDADVSTWPLATDVGIRGGSYNSSGSVNYLSDRTNISSGVTSRNNNVGGRGARKILIAKVDYLVVGGGGGTARNGREVGGAGGGQVATGSKIVIAQSYSIVVGAGGSTAPGNGGQSAAFGITATGGNGNSSVNGASSGNGNAGGTDNNTYGTGGGGGGAGGAGQNGSNTKAGDGGIGIQSSISGIATYYGGGGGGGADWDIGSIVYGAGGQGGGGQGAQGHNDGSHPAVAGTANTGGGAGGPGQNGSYAGKVGGSGIVIFRYKTDGSDGISNTSTGGSKTTSGAYTIHTFTSSGTFVCVLSF
jgi:formylglycine-generating enzyme required for sulfatase activity